MLKKLECLQDPWSNNMIVLKDLSLRTIEHTRNRQIQCCNKATCVACTIDLNRGKRSKYFHEIDGFNADRSR